MSDEDDGYKCPKCGSENLKVVSCRVFDGDMPLSWDGFIPSGSTDDEIVECTDCNYNSDSK